MFTNLRDLKRAKDESGESTMKTWQEEIVSTEDVFREMLRYLESFSYLVVDLETTGLDVLSHKIVGIGLCGDETKGFYIPTGHTTVERQLPEAGVLERLKSLLEGKLIVAHNLKFEFSVFRLHGITLKLGFDTMLADYLLDVDAEHGLKEIAGRTLGAKNWATGHVEHLEDRPVAEVAFYCIEDVIRTRQLFQLFEPKINDDSELRRLYYEIELPLIPVLADMELHGYPIDAEYLKGLREKYEYQASQLAHEVCSLVGKEFNLSSTKDLAEVLYEKLALRVPGWTEKGKRATNEEALRQLRGSALDERKRLVIETLLEYRKINKWLSELRTLLKKYIHPETGRVHPQYSQTFVKTGRLSCNKPNIHAVPKEDEIRRVYVVGSGQILVGADYAQQEPRIMAHCSGDKHLLKDFADGRDPYSLLAKKLFRLDCSVEEIKANPSYSEYRKKAKEIQLAIFYKAGPASISRSLGAPPQEAKRLVEKYFRRFPRVRFYQERKINFAAVHGFVKDDLTGRRRFLPKTQRYISKVVNFPIQSAGAALIKLAMVRCYQFFRKECPEVQMVASRHDELQFLVPEAERDWAVLKIRKLMEEAGRELGLSVPMEVEIKVGRSWGDLIEWKNVSEPTNGAYISNDGKTTIEDQNQKSGAQDG